MSQAEHRAFAEVAKLVELVLPNAGALERQRLIDAGIITPADVVASRPPSEPAWLASQPRLPLDRVGALEAQAATQWIRASGRTKET